VSKISVGVFSVSFRSYCTRSPGLTNFRIVG